MFRKMDKTINLNYAYKYPAFAEYDIELHLWTGKTNAPFEKA
jgi:hypothetical protein